VTFVRIDENNTQISAAKRLIELDQLNTQDPDYSSDSSNSSSSESEPTQPKKRRGRLIKLPLTPTTQAKRGRPRKIPLSVEIGTTIATYQLAPYPETNITAYASAPNHDKPEPTTYEAAIYGPEGDQWKQAIKEKYNSIIENDTWDLVPLPNRRKALEDKWVFKRKFTNSETGPSIRYKARWVTKGYL
jgi:hypothetical protein